MAQIKGRPAAAWDDHEIDKFRRIWPEGSREEIQAAFPNRTWKALYAAAFRYGIERQLPRRAKKKRLCRLADDLTSARLGAKLSQEELADIIGYASGGGMARAEISGAGISLAFLKHWCEALGLELRAVPVPGRQPHPRRRRPRHSPQPAVKFENFDRSDLARWTPAPAVNE